MSADGIKFFFAIAISIVIVGAALSGAINLQKTQNSTIEKAGAKVEELLN